jgi:hypothetical protein
MVSGVGQTQCHLTVRDKTIRFRVLIGGRRPAINQNGAQTTRLALRKPFEYSPQDCEPS